MIDRPRALQMENNQDLKDALDAAKDEINQLLRRQVRNLEEDLDHQIKFHNMYREFEALKSEHHSTVEANHILKQNNDDLKVQLQQLKVERDAAIAQNAQLSKDHATSVDENRRLHAQLFPADAESEEVYYGEYAHIQRLAAKLRVDATGYGRTPESHGG